ncbi:hypothetical protein SAMN03097699_0128 [Flavobacteriaceae bacterium MAR_2010_188]|nr:hypothetical protein SAMN03097699_0128 [Flavobacteriaceae bacterium MAR_2010_188]
MAQDIREMLKSDDKLSADKMPQGHEKRFLTKLESQNSKKGYSSIFFLKIAASMVIFLGLGYGAFKYLDKSENIKESKPQEIAQLKTLGDVSPSLKKVEDYYVANINLELANMDINDDNKELFDGYIQKLEELNKEYERLSVELTESGPNELTVSALIDNLKFRLNLLYRLKNQLEQLGDTAKQNTIS